MNKQDVLRRRLYNQRLAGSPFDSPEEAVRWLGAVQSQDFAGAKWSVGQRVRGATDTAVERAFDVGTILRTHALRPTWHFVHRNDIRWILQATAPRVHALNAHYYRKLELDGVLFERCHSLLTRELEGGRQRTRAELGAALTEAGIIADGMRLAYIVMHAELEGLICSGPRRGKQFTYMLLEERAPGGKSLTDDEALAELALRFFRSHGPATLKDLIHWASLRMTEARAGLEAVQHHLIQETVEGRTYYWDAEAAPADPPTPEAAFLLPEYDECVNAYDEMAIDLAEGARPGELLRPLWIGDKTVGSWKRTITRNAAVVTVDPFVLLSPAERDAVAAAVERYGAFLEMPATLMGV